MLDQIRGRSYPEALSLLENMPFRACEPLKDLLIGVSVRSSQPLSQTLLQCGHRLALSLLWIAYFGLSSTCPCLICTHGLENWTGGGRCKTQFSDDKDPLVCERVLCRQGSHSQAIPPTCTGQVCSRSTHTPCYSLTAEGLTAACIALCLNVALANTGGTRSRRECPMLLSKYEKVQQ